MSQPVFQSSPLSPQSRRVAEILFSRCLENGKWPDRIEFTKYLYLLDWAYWRMKGQRVSDLHWKFFHYGPWAEDIIPAMEAVQSEFRLGWIDYSDEDRDVPDFDPVSEKLDIIAEGLIKRILSAFARKDASAVVDFCYRLTEPMAKAKRGEFLDFSAIPVTGEPPVFSPQFKSVPMPALSSAQIAARERVRERAKLVRERHRRWTELLSSDVYHRAMEIMRSQSEAPNEREIPKGVPVELTEAVIEELNRLRHG